ncbi:MAG: hypothetical protein CMG21_00200 [Candidatus Marinimicrobia bacterium]|nr:hypothetical protein [Candidatus Neomarinimicrobiota bacterium]
MLNINIKYLLVMIILQGFLLSDYSKVFGIVLDSETQSPIENGTVFIKKIDYGTTTDKDGYFQLIINNELEKSINLSIKMIGYEELSILIDSNNNLIDLGTIYLKNNPIELEASHIHSHNDQSKQISDSFIAGLELDENLKSNIAMTLSNYSNIGVNSYGSVTSKPAVRGFSGDRFLLTKDGSETGDLSQSAIDHVITLDMTEVQNIELIRGPKSLVFGANAIGGVVNTSLISNPKIKVDKIYQRYFIGNESYNNGIYGNVMLYIPLLNNQLNFFISDRKTDNEITAIGELNNTQSHIANYKFGFTNYNKKGYINFSYEDFNMDYGIPPNTGGHITGVDILLNKKSSQVNYHQDITNISSQLDIRYNYIDYIHLELVDGSINNESIFEIFDGDNYHLALAKETHDFQIELSSNKFVYGLEYNKKYFTPHGFYLTPQTEESFLSLYGFKDEYFEKLDIDFLSSFRLGYLSVNPKNIDDIQYINLIDSLVKKRNFKAASFSFGVRKKINKIELNSWIMHTMRPPRVEELYSDGPHLGTYAYEIGNPNLEIEKIYGIENSLSFKNAPINFSLVTFFNYSPYFYEITKMGDCPEALEWDPLSGTSHPCAGADFIDWGSGEFGFLYKYNTRGSEAIIKGLELNLGYKLKNLELSYNFSLVNGDNQTLNMPLSYMNPMKQILNFDYNFKSTNYKIRFSKIHSQDRLGEFETYTPGAFLTDFIISYRYKKLHLTFQLNNIFDEIYYNHLSRIKNITPESGRNISFNCKLMF